MTKVSILSNVADRSRFVTSRPNAWLAVSLLAVVGSSLFFYLFPQVDLSVSQWFYSDDGFVLPDNPQLRALRVSADWAVRSIALLALIQLVRLALTRRLARQSLWLLSSLVVGPGILVNGILKEVWGRPRPRNTDIFGGDAPFQNVWVISDWCESNCSFVSGEASGAAWLVAAAFLAPRPIRAPVIGLTAVYAFSVSLNRAAFGGHYLSDIVLAWLVCAPVFLALARLILTKRVGGAM